MASTYKFGLGGFKLKCQEFTTSGDNSWTPPAGMINGIAFFEAVGGGGGGGGGGSSTNYFGGGGGGGGMYVFYPVKIANLGSAHNVRVGAGGTAGATAGDGGAGGDSYLEYSSTKLIIARGGKLGQRGASSYMKGGDGGGVWYFILGDGGTNSGTYGNPGEAVQNSFPGGINGAGGGGGGVDANEGGQGGRSPYSWQAWINGGTTNGTRPGGGGGGSSLWGEGGAGGNAPATAGSSAAANSGAGGGGGAAGLTGGAGGTGGSGKVRIWWLE